MKTPIYSAALACTCLTLAVVLSAAHAQEPNPPKIDYRKVESDIQAHNAARIDKGGTVTVTLLDDKVVKDRRTQAEDVVDGSVHTRLVMTGTPYRYRMELIDQLPVNQINFICSDYTTETTPKDVEIRLSDGTVLKHTLEADHPARGYRGPMPRQPVDVDKTIEWVEVTVLNHHQGQPNPKTGKSVGWGGIAEIEVITTADLTPYLVVADHNPDAPVYVRATSPRNDYSDVRVRMPEPIPMGQHPGIYLSREELVELRENIVTYGRATNMYNKLVASCDTWAGEPVELPDPAIPAQMKDRGDAAAVAHDLWSKKAGWLGWSYQLTDNEKYAEKAREILIQYAKLYPNDYKEHKGVHGSDTSKVMAQRLSEAMWLLPLIQSYDLICSARCVSDADRKLIEDDLIRHAITFIHSKKPAADEAADRRKKNPNWRTDPPEVSIPRKAVGNWVNFYNAAYIQGGIAIGDQDWIDIGVAGTKWMLANGIGEDGMWGEGAIGYQLFARQALVACIEAAARKGIDIWGFDQCRFKNLFDSVLKYAYPDGTSPGINDSGRSSVGGGWQAMAYDFAHLRYGDPNYGVLVNVAPRQLFQSSGCYYPTVICEDLREIPMEGLTSLVFDKLGYGILRGNDGGSDTFLLMDYGPHGGGHGHPDKLNLILFADGDELAGEPQGYRYEDTRHGTWTRPTIAHWTVVMDEKLQVSCTGKLLAFCDEGDIKIMRGEADGAYAGVVLDRTVVQMPGYIVDVYRAWGPAKHTFDYPLCFRGELDALVGVDKDKLKPMGLPTQPGYRHIMMAGATSVDGNWSGVWQREKTDPNPESETTDGKRGGPANRVSVTVLGKKGTQVTCGTVPGDRHQAVVRREGREAVFISVIDPYLESDAVKSVKALPVEGPVSSQGLIVTRADGGQDIIVVRYDPHAESKPAAASQFSEGQSDALVSVIRLNKDAQVIAMGIAGGTQVSWGKRSIAMPEAGIVFER